jgi:drug/metabolite transporter (DMT)-like permease
MLILGPVLMASINISLRYMRKMHEYTTSTYSVLFSLVFYGTLIATTSAEFSMFRTFSGYEHLILIFISLAGGIGMLSKTKALQYEMAGRLGILVYFSIIFTYFFDMLFIGSEFHSDELQGVTIVLLANILSAFMVFHKYFIKKDH